MRAKIMSRTAGVESRESCQSAFRHSQINRVNSVRSVFLFPSMIDTDQQLSELLPRLRDADWVALDTEADSLHAYPEKLCLLQISIANEDLLIDPLAKM